MNDETRLRRIARYWPWAVLLLAAVPAVWHFVDFPDDIDGEYPRVERPTFSARPPSTYRLAEPGDTIDRLALYASAVSATLAACAWIASRGAGPWPAFLAASVATGWFAATPGPCYDGWHGLGFRAIADPTAPIALRAGLALVATVLLAVALGSLARFGPARLWSLARERRASALLAASIVLMGLRLFDPPGVEPIGYWPRWCFAWGAMAMGLALVRLFPAVPFARPGRLVMLGAGAASIPLLIAGGVSLIWLHRPLERLRAVEPGKVYISAMPTYRGLQVEHARLKFRTIINLFPEDTAQRSPRVPEERRFAAENGILYVDGVGTPLDSQEFLDHTLALAQDPERQPVLIHCHGCMDRSPAWMGIYRFVVQGRPLLEILREIEAHRGVRPKASITLLYNYTMNRLAPNRFAADPTSKILKQAAGDAYDPYQENPAGRTAGANRAGGRGVSRR